MVTVLFQFCVHAVVCDNLVMRIEEADMVSYTATGDFQGFRSDVSLDGRVRHALSLAPYGRFGYYSNVESFLSPDI